LDGGGTPRERAHPAYDLLGVQQAFREGRFAMTARVRRHVRRKGWDVGVVRACIEDLVVCDFHKSQEHHGRPGVWLDIYRPVQGSRRLYVKFVLDEAAEAFLVLSFCVDGEPH